MRTTPNIKGEPRLLVSADIEQKEKHSFKMPDGTTKAFYLGSHYSEDNRISKPTLAQVVTECEELNVGDVVLFTHAVLSNNKLVAHEDYTDGSERLFLIDKSSVAFYIRKDEIFPVGDNLLVERLFYPELISPGGIILSTEKVKIENRLRVLKVPEGVSEVYPGDIVVTFKWSDYELVYNYNNVQQSIIRCLFSRDVVAVDTDPKYENY